MYNVDISTSITLLHITHKFFNLELGHCFSCLRKDCQPLKMPNISTIIPCRVKLGKWELLVKLEVTSLINGNLVLLQIYAVDLNQIHVNLKLDRCIFTEVEKNMIFRGAYEKSNHIHLHTRKRTKL